MFAVAAIGSMMALAGEGRDQREGTRMGLCAARHCRGLWWPCWRRACRCSATDLHRHSSLWHRFCLRSLPLYLSRFDGCKNHGTPTDERQLGAGRIVMNYDVIVVGGGPSGATAAEDLARSGHKVAMLDRQGRIKPCGGAIPPRLIADFDIPDEQLVAKINTARMISPTQRQVDIPIEDGFVGMVTGNTSRVPTQARRKRWRPSIYGTYTGIERDEDGTHVVSATRSVAINNGSPPS